MSTQKKMTPEEILQVTKVPKNPKRVEAGKKNARRRWEKDGNGGGNGDGTGGNGVGNGGNGDGNGDGTGGNDVGKNWRWELAVVSGMAGLGLVYLMYENKPETKTSPSPPPPPPPPKKEKSLKLHEMI